MKSSPRHTSASNISFKEGASLQAFLGKLQINSEDIEALASRGEWLLALDQAMSTCNPRLLKKNDHRLFFDFAYNLGANGQIYKSALCHVYLIGIDNKDLTSIRNLALLLRKLGSFSEAEHLLKEYLQRKPDCPLALNTYGALLVDLGRDQEALTMFLRALEIDKKLADAHANLASIYHVQARLDESFIHSSRSIYLKPSRYDLILDHYTHLRRLCCFDRIDKIDWFKLYESTDPGLYKHSLLQLLVLVANEQNSQLFLQLAKTWGEYAQTSYATNDNDCKRKRLLEKSSQIRVGFLSGDFKDHSVARFIWPLFENLPAMGVDLVCLSSFECDDFWQKRFKDRASSFYDISSLSPRQFHELCDSIHLDVIIDLTGFTKGSRLHYLARRCAPVQISWLGFPATAGLRTIDYIFTDQYIAPTTHENITENLLLSAGTSICFSSLDEVSTTQYLPSQIRGYITFGTLNNPYKYTPQMIELWASVMLRIQNSKILFVRREFDSYTLRNNLIDEFLRHGVDPSRLLFCNNRKLGLHYLDMYNQIDLCMDTYPVTGGTTTLDSLWMGVPVVALNGSELHQRISSGILRHLALDHLVAGSCSAFIEISCSIAADENQRNILRTSLRQRIKESLLCDTTKFANDFKDSLLGALSKVST